MKVKELIELLSKFDGEMNVEMGMNQEYQQVVDAEDISVECYDFHNDGKPYLMIGE